MGVGLDPANVDVTVVNRLGSALVPGDVVVFCTAVTSPISGDGVTVVTQPGEVGSVFASVAKYQAFAERPIAISAVVLEGGADQARVRVRVRGIVKAYVYNSANATVGPGEHLTLGFLAASKQGYYEAGNTSTTATSAGDSCKIHGYTLESVSGTTSDGTLTKVLIDGLNGFGGLN